MCSIHGCEKPRRTRGLCNAHYERWRKHGNTGAPTLKPWGVKSCQVAECNKPHRSNGYCVMHHRRWAKHGDPLKVATAARVSLPGPLSPHWKGENAGYQAAHNRVRAQRGAAREHRCQHCGNQAEHWAYDHADPAQREGGDGHGKVMPYSLDPAHYMPLCVPCHRRFDAQHGSRIFGRAS